MQASGTSGSPQRQLDVALFELLDEPQRDLSTAFIASALPQPKCLTQGMLSIVYAPYSYAGDRIQCPQTRALVAALAGLAQRQHGLTMLSTTSKPPCATHLLLFVRLVLQHRVLRA